MSKKAEINEINTDSAGRIVMCKMKFDGIVYLLGLIYSPNTDDLDFIVGMTNMLENYSVDNIIIGGDFNFPLDENLDAKYRNPSHH